MHLPIDDREKWLLSRRFAGEKKNDVVVRQSTQSLSVLAVNYVCLMLITLFPAVGSQKLTSLQLLYSSCLDLPYSNPRLSPSLFK